LRLGYCPGPYGWRRPRRRSLASESLASANRLLSARWHPPGVRCFSRFQAVIAAAGKQQRDSADWAGECGTGPASGSVPAESPGPLAVVNVKVFQGLRHL